MRPGSWFATTECFGPVLGVVRVDDLDEAIAVQNSTAYGLTAGLHALDPAEIDRWCEAVEAGNLYVNRHTTGAIVQRLAKASNAAVETPAVRERFKGIGVTIPAPERRTPEYLAKFVPSEIARWAGPIKASGASAD